MADFVRSTPFSVGEAFFGLTLLGGLETSLGPWYPTFSIYVHMRYTGGFSESTNGGLRGRSMFKTYISPAFDSGVAQRPIPHVLELEDCLLVYIYRLLNHMNQ